MRIAIAGKGGSGKTTFCSVACRSVARLGRTVVAVDADTNPNLHTALGVGPDTTPAPDLAPGLVSRRFDGPRLTMPITAVLTKYATKAPDGVHLLRMGAPEHPDEGCMCSAHATVSAVLADLGEQPDTVTFIDLEASPEHLSRGTARHADLLILIAEPYFRSLEAARLQASLAAETSIRRIVVVANKCRTRTDSEAVREFCARHGLDLQATLGWSNAALDADAARMPLIDYAPRDPVVVAVTDAIGRLVVPATLGAIS